MNRISTYRRPSKYVEEPHLVVLIDRVALDEILHAVYPHQGLLGLVPTLLNWMDSSHEVELTWVRILPQPGTTTVAPILICPDDLDFFCTTVVVEVGASEVEVEWLRVGIDLSEHDGPHIRVGEKVEWFDDLGPYRFSREDYEKVLTAFRDSHLLDSNDG